MERFKVELKWGLIFFVVGILWMMLEKTLGWHDEHIQKHAIYTLFFAIPAIIMIVLAVKDKRDNFYGGKMNWMQGTLVGLFVGIVVGVLAPVSQWLISNVISPDYFSNAIEYAVESKRASQEAAERYFNYTSYTMQAAFSAPIMGIITSAVASIFLKTD